MSENGKKYTRDYSRFDAMDTKVLREILRQDSQLSGSGESDIDALIYIMGVISRREKEQSTLQFTEVDAAWESFNKNYLPDDNDGQSLYDDNETDIQGEIEDIDKIPSAACKPKRRSIRLFIRAATIAALTIATIFVGSLTAYAFGYDLWGAVAQWTKSTFGFESSSEEQSQQAADKEVPPQLDELYRLMSNDGLSGTLLPGYIPEGYETVDVQYDKMASYIDYWCQLEKGQDQIMLSYTLYLDPDSSFIREYEKDMADPEVYTSGGVSYYIMTNMGSYLVAWTSENVECSIAGMTTYDETIKVIDSIAGGQTHE